jgi:hypothetical protein
VFFQNYYTALNDYQNATMVKRKDKSKRWRLRKACPREKNSGESFQVPVDTSANGRNTPSTTDPSSPLTSETIGWRSYGLVRQSSEIDCSRRKGQCLYRSAYWVNAVAVCRRKESGNLVRERSSRSKQTAHLNGLQMVTMVPPN